MREIPADTRCFHYYNPNPKGRAVGDCTYRALSVFLDVSWEDIAALDMDYYLRTGGFFNGHRMMERFENPSGDFNVETFLVDDFGCRMFNLPLERRPVGFTIKGFIDEFAEQEGVYYVAISGHAVAIKDKRVWDIWDSSNCSPNKIYLR